MFNPIRRRVVGVCGIVRSFGHSAFGIWQSRKTEFVRGLLGTVYSLYIAYFPFGTFAELAEVMSLAVKKYGIHIGIPCVVTCEESV